MQSAPNARAAIRPIDMKRRLRKSSRSNFCLDRDVGFIHLECYSSYSLWQVRLRWAPLRAGFLDNPCLDDSLYSVKKPISFDIEKKGPGLARAGRIHTPHGVIETPAFIAVGTKATVRGLSPEMVRDAGAQAVLSNTYHLYMQPGQERIKAMGKLQGMLNWNGPTMTDSGGFQAFSLGVAFEHGISKFIASEAPAIEVLDEAYDKGRVNKKAVITEDGVEFQSMIDGSTHFFSPEKSIEIQHDIGADIILAFDECTSPHASYEYLREAMERTHRWAERSLAYHKGSPQAGSQALFGIVQGGRHKDLREESARTISAMDFDGFAIGGSFVKEDMNEAVRWVNSILPEGKPRHLLGVGEPEDFFDGIENGCDTFDCITPTRLGRHGTIYTKDGKKHITNARYQDDLGPLDEGCGCYACKNFSRAYVNHLHRSKEMFGLTLASVHNLHFLVNLVKDIRRSLLDGNFDEHKRSFLARYKAGA